MEQFGKEFGAHDVGKLQALPGTALMDFAALSVAASHGHDKVLIGKEAAPPPKLTHSPLSVCILCHTPLLYYFQYAITYASYFSSECQTLPSPSSFASYRSRWMLWVLLQVLSQGRLQHRPWPRFSCERWCWAIPQDYPWLDPRGFYEWWAWCVGKSFVTYSIPVRAIFFLAHVFEEDTRKWSNVNFYQSKDFLLLFNF